MNSEREASKMISDPRPCDQSHVESWHKPCTRPADGIIIDPTGMHYVCEYVWEDMLWSMYCEDDVLFVQEPTSC